MSLRRLRIVYLLHLRKKNSILPLNLHILDILQLQLLPVDLHVFEATRSVLTVVLARAAIVLLRHQAHVRLPIHEVGIVLVGL